eukprot:437637-Hanusia_phi.AAC.1
MIKKTREVTVRFYFLKVADKPGPGKTRQTVTDHRIINSERYYDTTGPVRKLLAAQAVPRAARNLLKPQAKSASRPAAGPQGPAGRPCQTAKPGGGLVVYHCCNDTVISVQQHPLQLAAVMSACDPACIRALIQPH